MTTGTGAHAPDPSVAATLTWPEAKLARQESKIDTDPDSESESVNAGFSKGLSCTTVSDIDRERDRERDREVQDIVEGMQEQCYCFIVQLSLGVFFGLCTQTVGQTRQV